jgi:hypothetical protein
MLLSRGDLHVFRKTPEHLNWAFDRRAMAGFSIITTALAADQDQ